jgi:hypothetical protein
VNVEFVRRRQGGSWITVFTSYTAHTANALPSHFNDSAAGPTLNGIAVSGWSNVTATGGTGNYTYSWRLVSGDTRVHAVTPTSSGTVFRVTSFNGSASATFVCDVSDGVTTTSTNPVGVTLTYHRDTGGGGPPQVEL